MSRCQLVLWQSVNESPNGHLPHGKKLGGKSTAASCADVPAAFLSAISLRPEGEEHEGDAIFKIRGTLLSRFWNFYQLSVITKLFIQT